MGSGSSASVMVRPDLSASRTRWAACCSRFSAIRSIAPGSPPIGRNVAGTVLTLPVRPASGRQQLGEQISQAVAIGYAFGKAPIRLIDVLLDPRPVKRSVRKAVDGEDVQPFAGEEILECLELRGIRKGLRSDCGEAEANAHGFVGDEQAFHLWADAA